MPERCAPLFSVFAFFVSLLVTSSASFASDAFRFFGEVCPTVSLMSVATVHRRAACTHRSRPRLLLALGQTGSSIIRLICICFFQCLCSMSEASHMASTNLLQSRAEVFFGSTALVFLAKPNQLLMMLPIKWQQTTQVDVLRTTTNKVQWTACADLHGVITEREQVSFLADKFLHLYIMV